MADQHTKYPPLDQADGMAYRSLIVHEGVTFENATLYVSGHEYVNCTFRACTLVFTSLSRGGFIGCHFPEPSGIRLEVTVHDAVSASQLSALLRQFEVMYPPPEAIRDELIRHEENADG